MKNETRVMGKTKRPVPHSGYFTDMTRAIMAAGITGPRIIIDLDRVDENIERLRLQLPPEMKVRVSVKAVPSIPLIATALNAFDSDRVMVFNLQMAETLDGAIPGLDMLFGKPQLGNTLRAWLAKPRQTDPVWLIDSMERLEEFHTIAVAHGRKIRVALEIDIGLHRGGFSADDTLRAALKRGQEMQALEIVGYHGYESHIVKVPILFGLRRKAVDQSATLYRAANEIYREVMGEMPRLRNAGGSMTFQFYNDTSIANEVSIGSAFIKPTEFDIPSIGALRGAAFIAAPVLKAIDGLVLPGLPNWFANLWARLSPHRRQTLFIHGGNWLAEPESPYDLRPNPLVGRSSNQEMLNCGVRRRFRADDFVFFRPRVSEVVLGQFGDLMIYRDGQIVDQWPVFSAAP
ncbi:alanine racemase [Paracoccaceae bacterium GXU_MW_L88]